MKYSYLTSVVVGHSLEIMRSGNWEPATGKIPERHHQDAYQSLKSAVSKWAHGIATPQFCREKLGLENVSMTISLETIDTLHITIDTEDRLDVAKLIEVRAKLKHELSVGAGKSFPSAEICKWSNAGNQYAAYPVLGASTLEALEPRGDYSVRVGAEMVTQFWTELNESPDIDLDPNSDTPLELIIDLMQLQAVLAGATGPEPKYHNAYGLAAAVSKLPSSGEYLPYIPARQPKPELR